MASNAVRQLTPPTDGPDVERLSGPGLRAFLNLGEAWGLSGDEQRQLLGGIAKTTFFRWKRDRDALLSIDQLERISHLLGIYKNLQILLPTTGDDWVRSPNDHPMFEGMPPVRLLARGGITALRRVRTYLDAQRGGWA